MKALSKENTPFVNEVTPADQNNNVQNEDNNGSNKEVNLDDLRKKYDVYVIFVQILPFIIHDGCTIHNGLAGWTGSQMKKLVLCTSARTLYSCTCLSTRETPEYQCVPAH